MEKQKPVPEHTPADELPVAPEEETLTAEDVTTDEETDEEREQAIAEAERLKLRQDNPKQDQEEA